MRNALVVVGIGVIILGVGWWYIARSSHEVEKVIDTTEQPPQADSQPSKEPAQNRGATIGEENVVEFKCDGGKTVTAVFERDIVGVTLSDGRQLELRQAPSGSGTRYLSNDSKIEFRGIGNEGTLIEAGATTYAHCAVSI